MKGVELAGVHGGVENTPNHQLLRFAVATVVDTGGEAFLQRHLPAGAEAQVAAPRIVPEPSIVYLPRLHSRI